MMAHDRAVQPAAQPRLLLPVFDSLPASELVLAGHQMRAQRRTFGVWSRDMGHQMSLDSIVFEKTG